MIKKSCRSQNPNGRWLYIFLGILMMMLLGTVYSYSIFRVALENELSIGSAESGMPYMVSLAFYALFMFLAGKHIERFHPRTILIFGGSLVALGWILSSFATHIILLTISYGCISGAGVGIAYGVPIYVISKWFPDKKGLAVGLVLVGFGLSPLITAPIVSRLVEHYGVMKSFFILGLSFSILFPILAVPFKNPESKDISAFHTKNTNTLPPLDIPLKEMVKARSFKGLYINFIIGTMIGLMMIGMTTNIGRDYFELEAYTVTRLMAIFAICNGFGRPIFGWITDRFSSKIAILFSYFLVATAAMSIVVLNKQVGVYIASFSIFWFNLGGWLSIAPTSTLKLYGIKNYSQNYGLMFTAYGIGAIAGVSTSGMLLDHHGDYRYVFYYVIALCLLGLFLSTKYIKNESECAKTVHSK